MMELKLTRGYTTTVDDEDYTYLSQFPWYASNDNGATYAAYRRKHKTVRLHRLLTKCPNGFDVDHINHNPLDNRKCNLRVVPHIINAQNQKVRESNKYLGTNGVHWIADRKRWNASIMVNYKQVNLGRFKSVDEAIAVRKQAEQMYFKEKPCV